MASMHSVEGGYGLKASEHWTVGRELRELLGWRDGRTWRGLLYLLLSFPLGVAYFVFLATGIALGAGLAVTLLGLPVLAVMMLAWRQLGSLERYLVNTVLGAAVHTRRAPVAGGFLAHLKADLRDGYTWRSLAYLLVEFPFGVVAFTVTTTLVSLAVALTTAPIYFWQLPGSDNALAIDTFPKSLLACMTGIVFLALTPRAINGIAGLWAAFARLMLGPRD